jgi:8-oxo-dGTP pyrophosphatase MutT (NUDIX family)
MSMFSSKSVSGGSRVKAAGAVLWRPGAAGPRIALIYRARYDDWSFPKGKSDSGEHALLTAVREVEEETGVRAVLGRRLPNTEYEALGRPKRVKYWSGRALGLAEGVEEVPFTPNEEIDALEWVSTEEARRRLTSPLDVEVFEAFLAAPVATFPIILQRHGKAEHRGGAFPDDLARPLAPAGRQQAIALSQLLAVYGDRAVGQLAGGPLRRDGTAVRRAERRAAEDGFDADGDLLYPRSPRGRRVAARAGGAAHRDDRLHARTPARRTDLRGALRLRLPRRDRPGGTF